MYHLTGFGHRVTQRGIWVRIGVVIDAACDLPHAFIERHGIEILPINLRFGGRDFVDDRDPRATRNFLSTYIAEKDLDAEAHAPGVEQIKNLFLERIVTRYDRVLVICMSQTRAHVFANATQASFSILQGYRQMRAEAGISESFAMRVIDSQTLFAGEAVLAREAVRLAEAEPPFDQLRRTVEALSDQVHAYVVPEDLYYLRNRATLKGDRSVDTLTYSMGRLLDMKPILRMHRGESEAVGKGRGFENTVSSLLQRARAAIGTGLGTPAIIMSYGGDPDVIRRLPAYMQLAREADAEGVELMLAVMSATAGVHVGPGAFALAYIPD